MNFTDNSTVSTIKNYTHKEAQPKFVNHGQPEDDVCRHVILLYFSLKVIISFIGIICNCLTIYAFFIDRKKVSLVYNIIGLAIADCLLLVSLDGHAGVTHFVEPSSIIYYRELRGFLRSCEEQIRLINIWITVCICFERYRVVCISAIIDSNSVRYILARMFVVVVLCTATVLPEYLGIESMFYGIFYEIILFYLIQLILPTALLIYFTYHLRKSVIGTKDSLVQGAVHRKIALTKSLIIIIIMFIVSNAIDPLITIDRVIKDVKTSRTDCYSFYTNLRYISEILIVINCSANFFIYLHFNVSFNSKVRGLFKMNTIGTAATVSSANSEMI